MSMEIWIQKFTTWCVGSFVLESALVKAVEIVWENLHCSSWIGLFSPP